MRVNDIPENLDFNVKESYAGGAIKIETAFDLETNQDREYVNILGTRCHRRNPATDNLPGNVDKAEQFKDLHFEKTDLDFIEALFYRYVLGHHVIFLSHPGLGKSTLTRFFAYLFNVPFARVQCTKNMNVHQSFLWTYVRDNGTGKFRGQLGPLPQSMLDGAILLVDELPNLEPHERQVILEPTEQPNNPEFSPRSPTLHLNDFPNPELQTITAAPSWFLVATGNYEEGQGAGEIHPGTEREERRVRPHLMGAVDSAVKAGRMAQRHIQTVRKPKYQPTVKSFHRPEILESMPAELIENLAAFFTLADQVIKTEVLKQVKQDPQIYLNETADRAFDHFMVFQIKKFADSGKNPSHRKKEIIESALTALEFYYMNSFREETKIKPPAQFENELRSRNYLDGNGRIAATVYIAFRLRALLNEKFIHDLSAGIRLDISEQISKILGLPITTPPDAEQLRKEKELEEKMKKLADLMNSSDLEGNPALNPYYQFLEGLGLSEGDKEKLKKIPLGYNDAVTIARKQVQNPNLPVPTLEKTIQEIMKMPIDVLKEVAKFGKPTLLMTPPNTMAEKEAAMNAYKPYVEKGSTDNNQADMYFGEDKNSTLWGTPPAKLQITITDGKPTMPQLSNELLALKWGDRYKAVHADLKSRKLRMITAHEYAGLEQMSIMNYEKAKNDAIHPHHQTPEKEIVDFYVSGQNEVITAFYQPEDALTNLQKIPFGAFNSVKRQVSFVWAGPSYGVEGLRFRPSVQVFEF